MRDTGPANPIFIFPTHVFIDRDGFIRSIVLENMETERAVTEASLLLDEAVSAAAIRPWSSGLSV